MLSGKQIIHILPEGSALLNPLNEPFCIGPDKKQVAIPIQLNQTNPKSIDLLRLDIDGPYNETIRIGAAEVKKLMKAARQEQRPKDAASPLIIRYPSRKIGRYTLQKVLDETGLEVRPRTSELFVVVCPSARVSAESHTKCRGDLSDVGFEVEGTPPLKLKYAKLQNENLALSQFQSIQPDDFISPLVKQDSDDAGPLVRPGKVDVSWARSRKSFVPMNEILHQPGQWTYSVDSVEDALGNVVSYADRFDEDGRPKSKLQEIVQTVSVQDRPVVSLGCSLQTPLKVAKEEQIAFPLRLRSVGRQEPLGLSYTVEYLFTPEESLLENGEHNPQTQKLLTLEIKTPGRNPDISKSGLYTLKSVKAGWCEGDIAEPASCMLEYTPTPEVSIRSLDVTDKCDRMPVGLRVDLDFVGTPPFHLDYVVDKKGSKSQFVRNTFHNRREQIELKPKEAGHYTYRFTYVSDKFYKPQQISTNLEVDVKPSAQATFSDWSRRSLKNLCLGDGAEFKVEFIGESPWSLEYELVHGGKRTKSKVEDISDREYTIRTPQLHSGGEYSISLISVSDSRNCPETLNEDLKFNVQLQRPKAAFGLVDGKRSIQAVEGLRQTIPLKLTGERPWNVEVRNIGDSSHSLSNHFDSPNSELRIDRAGTYEIVSVRDSVCNGQVDDGTNKFIVSWIDRPQLRISDSPTVEKAGTTYRKSEVCEGDEDYLDVAFSGKSPNLVYMIIFTPTNVLLGTPPFDVDYEVDARPDHGPKYRRAKELPAPMGVATIQLDTSNAGEYQYEFVKLKDKHYIQDKRQLGPIIVKQKVNARPTARFANPGRTYSFCKVEDKTEELVPITFTGIPPFYIEVEIKHSGSSKTDILAHSKINSLSWSLPVPRDHPYLRQGQSHLTIRKVRDSRGCQSLPLSSARSTTPPPRVQISVHDPPTITPVESKTDFCIGEKPSFRLSGSPPFTIYYTFASRDRKAVIYDTTFSRWAEGAGNFTITAISDSASDCRAPVSVTKTIHAVPQAHIARGKQEVTDIHEGGTAELVFTLEGEPPFEFTYTRSSLPVRGKSVVLETRTEVSESKVVRVAASEEGEYEVISVRDRWCAASKAGGKGKKAQKLLMQ